MGMEQSILDIDGSQRDDESEDHSSSSGIGGGFGVRDHEKREDQQRPAFDLMEWDGQWIA